MSQTPMAAGRFSEGEFRVGHVLSRTFEVLSRNLVFCIVTAIAYLPNLAFLAERGQPSTSGRNVVVFGGGVLLALMLSGLSTAIVLFGAFEDMRGRPVNLMASVQVGLSRFLPVLGVAILGGICTAIAGILLVIPALIVFTMLYVATPACVVERLGPVQSLRRSSQLTKGYRWKIFGLLFLVGIIFFIGGGVAKLFAYLGGTSLSLLVNLLWSALVGAFSAIMGVVVYRDLRVVKEGVDTDKIASVFD